MMPFEWPHIRVGRPLGDGGGKVRFAPNGAITDTAGHNITIDEDLSITPKLSAKEAVLKTVQFLTQNSFEEREVLNDDEFVLSKNIEKIDLSSFNPKIVQLDDRIDGCPTLSEYFHTLVRSDHNDR